MKCSLQPVLSFKAVLATCLCLGAVAAWALSLRLGGADPPPLPQGDSGCKGGYLKVPTVAELQAQVKTVGLSAGQNTTAEIDPIVVGDNCAQRPSCDGSGLCVNQLGGSRRFRHNGIPACIKDPHPKCYHVDCVVESWIARNCPGPPDDEVWYRRRGCRQVAT